MKTWWHNEHVHDMGMLCVPPHLVFGLSTIDSSTRDSSIIFVFQLLIASRKEFKGGVWGVEPPRFSIYVLGLVSREYDVLVFRTTS